MKVLQDGKVRLEKGERRIGNFFIKLEDNHVKIQDLSSMFTHRVSRRLAIGIWLENMMKLGEKGEPSLKAYFATAWTVFTVVPDDAAIDGFVKLSTEAINRHPEWYGGRVSDKPEADEEALKAVEGVKEFEGDVKKALENATEKDDAGKE